MVAFSSQSIVAVVTTMTRLMDVVVARHDYVPTEEGCILLRRGDIILVVSQDNSGWWDGILYENRERGWFPSEYVITASQEVVDKVGDFK